MKEIVAILCGEPWCLLPEQCRNISVSQFQAVFHHPRDEKGCLDREPRVRPKHTSARDEFFALFRLRRYSEELIEKKWRERERTNGE